MLAPRLSRARRRRGVAEARGRQPDRLVQGPRDDLRGLATPCARAPRRSSAPRPATPRRRWPPTRRAPGCGGAVIVPEGKIATGKLAQALMHGARVDRAARQLRRGARRSCASSPSATRSRSSTRSTRSGSRARRPRRSRSSRSSATRSTRSASRSATPATSPPTGRASRRSAHAPRMLGFQAAGAAPLVHGAPVEQARDGRQRDPDRQPGALGGGDGRR